MKEASHHRWGDPVRFEPHESPNGCAQTERTCQKCGLVRITVHPPQGLPWLEWRTRDPGHPTDAIVDHASLSARGGAGMINLGAMKRADVPARCEGVTWVYVLGAGEPAIACKIGIAVELYVRLKRTAHSFRDRAFPVGLYCAYAVMDTDPRSASFIESAAQGRLVRWAWGHPGGDWFLVRPERGEAQLRAMLTHYGMSDAQRFPVPT